MCKIISYVKIENNEKTKIILQKKLYPQIVKNLKIVLVCNIGQICKISKLLQAATVIVSPYLN